MALPDDEFKQMQVLGPTSAILTPQSTSSWPSVKQNIKPSEEFSQRGSSNNSLSSITATTTSSSPSLFPSSLPAPSTTFDDDSSQLRLLSSLSDRDSKALRRKLNQPLVPPFRYSIVEMNRWIGNPNGAVSDSHHTLYRGAFPTLKNFRFLTRLKLKSVVSLTPEKPTVDLIEFCQFYNIKSLHYKVKKYKESVTITPEQVSSILQAIITPDNLPAYIHCLDGSFVTSLVIACLRKLMYWSSLAIKLEFERFCGQDSMISAESKFIKQFKGAIVVPSHVAEWLWKGKALSKHPSIKLVRQALNSNDQPDEERHNELTFESKQEDVTDQKTSQPLLAGSDDIIYCKSPGICRSELLYFDIVMGRKSDEASDSVDEETQIEKHSHSRQMEALALEDHSISAYLSAQNAPTQSSSAW